MLRSGPVKPHRDERGVWQVTRNIIPGENIPENPLVGSEAIVDSQPPGRSCIGPNGPGRS